MNPPRPAPAGWLAKIPPRLADRWALKMVATAGAMAVFFAAYFQVMRHPLYPPCVMPLTALDRGIGFHPAALVVYVSLWPYVALVPALLVAPRDLAGCAAAWTVLAAAGLGVFLFWPTTIPPAGIDWGVHPHFAFLKNIDASGNACPSLHVAFAVFSAAWFGRILRFLGAGPLPRAANVLWCLAIAWSTVAVRQHVVLDAVAGAALGLAVALAHLRLAAGTPRR